MGSKQLNRAANERISQGFSDPVEPERVNIWITELISTIRIFYPDAEACLYRPTSG